MCFLQRLADLGCNLYGIFRFGKGHLAPELAPLDIFHHHEERPVGILDAMDDADVRMIQTRCRLSLLEEACLGGGVLLDAVGEG